MFAPNYQTPRSVQMNLGIQKEIRHGMVASVDYLRNKHGLTAARAVERVKAECAGLNAGERAFVPAVA